MATTPNEQFDDELLSAYLDGELDAATRAVVDDRLRTDERARRLLAELRQASDAVKALPRATLGRDLRGSVLAAIEKAAVEPATIPMRGDGEVIRSTGRGWVWAGLAVALAASVMVVAVIPTRLRNENAATAPQVAELPKAARERESATGDEAPTSAATEATDGEAAEAAPTAEPATAPSGESLADAAAGKTNDTQRAMSAAAAPGGAAPQPPRGMTKGAVSPAPAAAVAPADDAAVDDVLNVQVVDEIDSARFNEILAENQIDLSDAQLPAAVTATLVEAVDDDDGAVEAVLVEATPQQLAAIRRALATPSAGEFRGVALADGVQEAAEDIRGRAWRLPRQQAAADDAASVDAAATSDLGAGQGDETRRERLVRALFLLKRTP